MYKKTFTEAHDAVKSFPAMKNRKIGQLPQVMNELPSTATFNDLLTRLNLIANPKEQTSPDKLGGKHEIKHEIKHDVFEKVLPTKSQPASTSLTSSS